MNNEEVPEGTLKKTSGTGKLGFIVSGNEAGELSEKPSGDGQIKWVNPEVQ